MHFLLSLSVVLSELLIFLLADDDANMGGLVKGGLWAVLIDISGLVMNGSKFFFW